MYIIYRAFTKNMRPQCEKFQAISRTTNSSKEDFFSIRMQNTELGKSVRTLTITHNIVEHIIARPVSSTRSCTQSRAVQTFLSVEECRVRNEFVTGFLEYVTVSWYIASDPRHTIMKTDLPGKNCVFFKTKIRMGFFS